MNERQISEILREYEKRRHFAELKRTADYENAMTFPEFSALQKNYNGLVVKPPEADVEAEIAEIRKKQAAVLKKLKIDDFFETQYLCARCKDTGYENGKLCLCVKKRLSDDRKNGAVPTDAVFENCDLSLFDADIRPRMAKVYSIAKKYVETFPPKNKPNIFITGGTGTGKTYLTACIFNALTKKDVFAEYLTAFGLGGLFLKSHLAPVSEKTAVLDPLFSADLLIVDDLGTEPIYNNITCEYLFGLINERTVNAKPTVISTNLSPADILSRYGERIFSRVCNKNNATLLDLPGKDLRLKK
ncbi:MAG: ATP-binding protein [Clostridiales bacterium]|jgi:DNA replication protein DnaC|nr:ATP-binding protein [Clostridiales bacterium]